MELQCEVMAADARPVTPRAYNAPIVPAHLLSTRSSAATAEAEPARMNFTTSFATVLSMERLDQISWKRLVGWNHRGFRRRFSVCIP